MRFAFIHEEKGHFSVASLCRVFDVTRQGYYAYANRSPSSRVLAEVELAKKIRHIFSASDETYGAPRVREELKRQGEHIGKRRIERAMRGLGLVAHQPRKVFRRGVSEPNHPVAPNELARDFTATRPNERWVSDITYVWTDEGWTYVAIILDLFSRSVVGWACDSNLSTRLPLAALDSAIRRRRPGSLLLHSDRGCQYTSLVYRDRLASLNITVSMSRKGNCRDNAVAESFFSTLKRELVFRRSWRNRNDLHQALFLYIETFYNRRRLHSTLDYKTPLEVENDFFALAS